MLGCSTVDGFMGRTYGGAIPLGLGDGVRHRPVERNVDGPESLRQGARVAVDPTSGVEDVAHADGDRHVPIRSVDARVLDCHVETGPIEAPRVYVGRARG